MSQTPRATASIAGHPLHAMLVPIPIACFIGTLITDIAYWRTANMQWANMSAWLLTVGLIVSVFAVIAGLIDFFGDRRIRDLRAAWIHALRQRSGLVLAIFNAFIHSRDAYTSVVPTGLDPVGADGADPAGHRLDGLEPWSIATASASPEDRP